MQKISALTTCPVLMRLMRADKPIGIWLLWWPVSWSLLLAARGLPDPSMLMLFFAGTCVMRSAGCVLNDLADRHIDAHVARTRLRPLASGEVTIAQALGLAGLLLTLALIIALQLPQQVLIIALLALPMVALYPFAKRISSWPQLFLGATFNLGVLMAWIALRGALEPPAIALYVAALFWTLGYDTIYGHQDAADDRRIGVKSSSLHLGGDTARAVALFYLACLAWLVMAGIMSAAGWIYFCGLLGALAHMGWQVRRLDIADPLRCMAVFRSNHALGAWITASILASQVF